MLKITLRTVHMIYKALHKEKRKTYHIVSSATREVERTIRASWNDAWTTAGRLTDSTGTIFVAVAA